MISIYSLRITCASASSLTNHRRWTRPSYLWKIRISTCISLMNCPRLLNPISKIIRGWSAMVLRSLHSWISQNAALLGIWPIALLFSLPSNPMPFLNLLWRSTVYGSSILWYLLLIDVYTRLFCILLLWFTKLVHLIAHQNQLVLEFVSLCFKHLFIRAFLDGIINHRWSQPLLRQSTIVTTTLQNLGLGLAGTHYRIIMSVVWHDPIVWVLSFQPEPVFLLDMVYHFDIWCIQLFLGHPWHEVARALSLRTVSCHFCNSN